MIVCRPMGLMDRVPVSVVRWAGREQFRIPLLGRLLRPAAKWLRRKPRVVPHGQAKGLVINPSGANPGYALGTSEPLVQDAFAEHVPKGGVVWDVGANVGFYTLIASRHRLANASAPTAIPKKAAGIEPRLLFITESPKVATRSGVLAVRDR